MKEDRGRSLLRQASCQPSAHSTQQPEEILTIADSMPYGGAVTQLADMRNNLGTVVVMGPEHAQLIAARLVQTGLQGVRVRELRQTQE